MVVAGGGRQEPIGRRAALAGPFEGEQPFPQHREMDDLEFKALAAVHRHQSHGVDAVHRRRGLA